jgi:multidrug efflux pump subunit AcrA (membrane-fusion protein)
MKSTEAVKDLQIPKLAHKAVSLVYDPRLSRVAARWAAGIFIGLVLVLFLPWTQNVHSTGKLTSYRPEDRPQEIQSIIGGRIEEWYVSEGQFVHAGDTIVRMSETKEKYLDTNILDRLKQQITAKEGSQSSTNEKVNALSDQINALQDGQILSMQKAENKVIQATYKVSIDSSEVVATMTDYEIAVVQLARADSLFKKGLISLTDFERRRLKVQEANAKRISAENKLLASRNEVINAQIEISSLEADYIDKISKAESELNGALSYMYETQGEVSKMNVDLMNLVVRQGLYFVTAPQDGYVVKAQKQGIGENVKEGDVVVTIMPSNPELAVELYVDPMDLPLLEKGREVRLQFEGWPALVFSGWPNGSFGTFGGVISVIDQVDTDGKYRILVVPDSTAEAWPPQVRVGSGVYGWVLLKDVSIWYEVWRQLNGFPPDYISPTTNKEESSYVK